MSAKKNLPVKKFPSPKKVRFISETEIRNIGLIILSGLVLRFVLYFELKNTPLFNNLYSDSKIFSDLAQNIVNGSWFGSAVFYMSPGFTYFLAIIYSLFGKDPGLVRIIQILVNLANVFVIYLLARELFSKSSGYIAAIISILYTIFIFYSSLILVEILFTFCISVFLLLFIRIDNNSSFCYLLITGLLLGIAALFRGSILLLFPVAVYGIYLVRGMQHPKLFFNRVFFFLIGIIIAVLPVTLNNYLAGNEVVLLTTNYGINLYIGNHESATGIYKIPADIDLSLDPTGKNYAEKITHKRMSDSEVSGFWENKAFEYMLSNPGKALGLTLKKIFLFFGDQENPQSFMMDTGFYARNYSFLLKLPLPGFYFVFLLAAAGMILSSGRNKKIILMYLFIAAYTISVIIFFVVGRFRVGIAPVLIIFAAYGIARIYELIKTHTYNKLIIPSLAIISLASVNFIFIPVYSFNDYDAYINLGNSSFEKQEYDEALSYYLKSVESKEESGTYVLIGNTLSVKKDVKGALDAYKKAIELNPGNPLAYFNIGTLFVQTGDYKRAVEAFNTSIKYDSSFADAYRNVAIIYYMRENYQESLIYFEKYLYFSKDDQTKESVRRDIEEIKKRMALVE